MEYLNETFRFSEELRDLDRNTAFEMIDQMRQQRELLARQKAILIEIDNLTGENKMFLKALDNNLQTRKFILSQQELVLSRLQQKEAELKATAQELEELRKNS